MRRWLLLAAVHLVSCSIERSEYLDEAPAQNECEQSSDCNGGPCSQGLCIADRAELDTLLFDVTLPATSGEYASVRYTKIATDLRKRKPQDAFDLDLDVVAAVTGTLQVKENPDSTCEYAFVDSDAEDGTLPLGDDDTVPGSVTFIPTDRWPGLPVTPYVSEAAALDSADPYEFLVRLAPGDYDVYVVPSGQPESACPVAPQILRGQQIQAGDVELKLQLPTPRKLSLQVLVPVGLSPDTLRGWRVDMLDSSSGLAVSTMNELDANPTEDLKHLVYETELFFSSVWDLSSNTFVGVGKELVRLRPPKGVLAPTVFAERASLELFQPGKATIELDALPPMVHVEGQVQLIDSDDPVSARLVFTAQELEGMSPGLLTSLVTEQEVDETGSYSVSLLPGQYTVRAIPEMPTCCASLDTPCDCPAPTEIAFPVSDRPEQAGRTLEVAHSISLEGKVRVPLDSAPLGGATVQATPVLTRLRTLDELLGTGSSRGVFATNSDSKGELALRVPSGSFSLSVIPPDGSRFAWRVDTMLEVGMDEQERVPEAVDLGELRVGLPVAYRGSVLVPSPGGSWVEVPGALIRAYAFLGEGRSAEADPASAASVVQVAETRAREDGTFELLVPSTLE